MVVIPITGGVLGLLALPFLPGIFWKFVAAIFFGYLAIGGALVGFFEYRRLKKEALK